jgi:hypothetical protein
VVEPLKTLESVEVVALAIEHLHDLRGTIAKNLGDLFRDLEPLVALSCPGSSSMNGFLGGMRCLTACPDTLCGDPQRFSGLKMGDECRVAHEAISPAGGIDGAKALTSNPSTERAMGRVLHDDQARNRAAPNGRRSAVWGENGTLGDGLVGHQAVGRARVGPRAGRSGNGGARIGGELLGEGHEA